MPLQHRLSKPTGTFSPGWLTTSMGLAPSAMSLVYPAITPDLTQWTLAGALAGVAFDGMLHHLPDSIVSKTLKTQASLSQKFADDFNNGSFVSFAKLQADRNVVIQRLRSLVREKSPKSQTAKSSLHFVPRSDPRLNCSRSFNDLKKYLEYSDCWNGAISFESLSQLRSCDEITVNSSSINVGIEATLLMMRDHFGIPLRIITGFAHGVEQTDALNSDEEADFVILSDTNMFTGGSYKTSKKYRFLLPCGWQEHKLVQRLPEKSYHKGRKIWFAQGSSGQEQLALNTPILRSFVDTERQQLEMNELGSKVSELDYGETAIAWDPLVSLMGLDNKGLVISSTGNEYRLSTSMYVHRDLYRPSGKPIRNAFQEAFIGCWNRIRIEKNEMLLELSLNKKVRRNFYEILSSHT